MRLFILPLALVVTTLSCKPGERATTSTSPKMNANRSPHASGASAKANEPCLNLNIATAEELIRLPGIGEVMARRIIDYRKRQLRFRRPEELIIIEGFSETKYRAIAQMICVD